MFTRCGNHEDGDFGYVENKIEKYESDGKQKKFAERVGHSRIYKFRIRMPPRNSLLFIGHEP